MIYLNKIQSENIKMIWNINLFKFSMICNIFKCDGFTVLLIQIVWYYVYCLSFASMVIWY